MNAPAPPELEIKPGPMAWMARNPVVANLIMTCLLVGGALMGTGIKQTVFPDFDLDFLFITVPYPGASPEETEKAICLRVEDAVRDVDGLKRLNCTAAESGATTVLELLPNTPKDRILTDVKSAVDRISSFPANVERPSISLLVAKHNAISLVLWGDADEKSLREQAERIRDEIADLKDVTNVKISGTRPLQTTVEIRRETLREHALTVPMVAAALRSASLDLPGGALKTRSGDILIRTKEQRFSAQEFAEITLISAASGSRLRLGDIAEIREEFRETDSFTTYNGKPAITLKIERVGTQTPRSVATAVKNYRKELLPTLPKGIHLDIIRDWSKMLDERMDLLMRNAWLGLTLVLVVLGLFLEIRLAFWVTLGIPISFLGSLLLLPAMGATINMISLFAFILVLGMVVDDAIVVGENVYELRQQGVPTLTAAIVGARQVGHPVTFSILTTMAAFAPLIFIGGMMGKFMGVIPLVVIAVLGMSLVEALYILPAHLSHKPKDRAWVKPFHWVQFRVDKGLQWFLATLLKPLISVATRARYTTIAICIGTVVLTGAAVKGGHIKFMFFNKIEADRIDANIEMIEGVSPEETAAVLQHVIDQAERLAAAFQAKDPLWQNRPACEGVDCPPDKVLHGVYARMGASLRERPGVDISSGGSHLASARLKFVPGAERSFSMGEFERRWRDAIGEPAGLMVIDFRSSLGPQFGAPISIEFSHTDRGELERAADLLSQKLRTLAGVVDIEDGRDVGKPELNISLRPKARALGLTERDLAMQVRGAFYGVEAQRQQVGRDEVRVMVTLPRAQRSHLADLEAMIVRTPQGGEIRLGDAALITMGGAATAVRRVDGKRTLTVEAKVDHALTDPQSVNKSMREKLLPAVIAEVPGLTYRFGGERREHNESMSSLFRGFVFAILCIYILVAIPFKSYLQPFAVMSAIPFGIVGAIWGHVILGMPLTILSLMGLLAVTGVVVNDSLVLVSFINDYRRQGHSLGEAAVVGAVRRFRPILLTSLTTFFGLAPMIVETSIQAKFLVPMAVSLAFGVAFATIFILIIVPCIYLVIEDLKALVGQGEAQETPTPLVVEPAEA